MMPAAAADNGRGNSPTCFHFPSGVRAVILLSIHLLSPTCAIPPRYRHIGKRCQAQPTARRHRGIGTPIAASFAACSRKQFAIFGRVCLIRARSSSIPIDIANGFVDPFQLRTPLGGDHVKRRFAPPVLDADRGTLFEQQLDQLLMREERSDVQRRVAVAVRDRNVGTFFDQQLGNIGLPEHGGRIQRRRSAAGLSGIDGHARRQEPRRSRSRLPSAAADQMSSADEAFRRGCRRADAAASSFAPSVRQYSLEAVRISNLSPATAGLARQSSSSSISARRFQTPARP